MDTILLRCGIKDDRHELPGMTNFLDKLSGVGFSSVLQIFGPGMAKARIFART